MKQTAGNDIGQLNLWPVETAREIDLLINRHLLKNVTCGMALELAIEAVEMVLDRLENERRLLGPLSSTMPETKEPVSLPTSVTERGIKGTRRRGGKREVRESVDIVVDPVLAPQPEAVAPADNSAEFTLI
jgi:hypothetical protein